MYSPNCVFIIPNNTLRVERDLCSIFFLFVEDEDFYGAACTGVASFLKAVLFLCGLGTVYSDSAYWMKINCEKFSQTLNPQLNASIPVKISNLSLSANLKTMSLFKIWGGLIRYIPLCSPLIKKGEHPKVISLFHLKKILQMTFSKLLRVQFQF